ncbi:MAG: hypothetical protein P1Q69_17545 [Candidatus Thorarchaeota archaeon]|nr:hypothetical protein [Candidatus Thorarchaeota archaeon]
MAETDLNEASSSTDSILYSLYKYYLHGFFLSIAMTVLLPFLSLILMFLSWGFASLTVLIDFPPPGVPYPFLYGIFMVNLFTLVLVVIVISFGSFNLFLTERIWKETQWMNWTRRVGVGAIFLACSTSYHITVLLPLLIGGYGLLLALAPSLTIFAVLDGVIGKHLARSTI